MRVICKDCKTDHLIEMITNGKCPVCRGSNLQPMNEKKLNEIKEVQQERSSVYGKFEPHAKAVDEIMESLRIVNCKKYGSPLPVWPKGFETAIFYMASKLARLAAAPDHKDSALDLSSYANLWLEIQKDQK